MSKVLMLGQQDVDRLLPMQECVGVMRETMRMLARGELHQPLRAIIRPPGAKGLLGTLPAYRGASPAAFGVKVATYFEENPSRGLPSHLGVVLLFNGETGELQAIANASAVTAIRTAAVSAVATDLLSGSESSDLAIVGSGVQAKAHVEAMACVRSIRHVRIAGRSLDRAEGLAGWARERYDFRVEAVGAVEDAVRGADLIVTVTNSREPVLQRRWIDDGAHINAVGSSFKTHREIDGPTMAAARLFVDRRESTVNESGDYLSALAEGSISSNHIVAELGDILIGAHPGRTSPNEITLFKSLGLAVEDLAAAEHIYRKALKDGTGVWEEV